MLIKELYFWCLQYYHNLLLIRRAFSYNCFFFKISCNTVWLPPALLLPWAGGVPSAWKWKPQAIVIHLMWGLSLTHWTFIENWICLAALQQDKICKLWHKMSAKVIAGIKCLPKILDLKQKHLKTKFWPKILEQELSTCVRCMFFPLGWTLLLL